MENMLSEWVKLVKWVNRKIILETENGVINVLACKIINFKNRFLMSKVKITY